MPAAFLLFETLDRSTWHATLSASREAYVSLRGHFLRAFDHPDEFDSTVDPLSDTDESPWVALRQDESLRAEILQDVDRCMPENLYFRQPPTQSILLGILFIFAKLNPDVGYRQGMHEVLAPILWVVERDAMHPSTVQEGDGEHALLFTTVNGNYVEHDTFTLFGLIMQNAKAFYETGSVGQVATVRGEPAQPRYGLESQVVVRCRRILGRLLRRVDPTLSLHLRRIEIVPQVFLMRWIRLLFGREFSLDQVLGMWDAVFAEDPTLEIVDFVCIAMLLRIRWQLINADYSAAITLLMKYPEQPADRPPHHLVYDAIYLRSHPDLEGGCRIIEKYSGRTPPQVESAEEDPKVPTVPDASPLHRSGQSLSSPESFSQHPGGLEAVLQEAARGVYTKGEKWGVNKILRDAVVEVRKNVQGLQQARSSSVQESRNIWLAGQSATAYGGDEPNLARRIEYLQRRNRSLSKMLEVAVAELWDQQKALSEKTSGSDVVKALSMAVAKVQMVQAYLEDETLRLPIDDTVLQPVRSAEAPPADVDTPKATARVESEAPEQSSRTSEPSRRVVESKRQRGPAINATPAVPLEASSAHLPIPTSTTQQRPPLAQSSFSWMLGQDPETSKPISPVAPLRSERIRESQRHSGVSFLFGVDDESSPNAKQGGGMLLQGGQDTFNLNTLRRNKRP